MTTTRALASSIKELSQKYGDSIPVDVLLDLYDDTRSSYVRLNLYLCPLTGDIINRNTGRVLKGDLVACGTGRSPISRDRTEFILKQGFDPVACGKDHGGLWYRLARGADKIYV